MTATRYLLFPSATLSVLAAACALAACTVGPDYRGAPAVAPEAASAASFVRTPAQGVTPTHAPSQWWLALDDPQLNALIDAALAHNPDLRAAQARLRASRAQLQQQRAAELPKIGASAAAIRMRQPNLSSFSSSSGSSGQDQSSGGSQSTSSGRGPITFYTAGFDASWEIDLFGGTRRAVEAASDEADAVDADLADTQVSLAAEVAQAYIDLRDEQQRLAIAQRTADLQQEMLTLTEQRRAGGTAAEVDVERLTTQVENTRSTITPLAAQVEISLDQLAVLTGQAPGALDAQLATAQPLPALPASVSVTDPTTMLAQRPDIRAAERRLASSNAQIGEHVADFLPKLTLFGDLGFSAAQPGHLFRKSNFSWVGVPYLQWNLFDFGRTLGAVHGAQASRDEAEARYEKAVLAALQDANASLSRYGYQREHLVTLQKVQTSAERSATLMRQRYRAGASSLVDLLDTQRTEFLARQNVVSGQADLLKDFVSLQKSLGLGWQTATPATPGQAG
ncbi:NodT family efflux transporter outer membrane factor (OMF) lipoprotein [Paraburkholderia unamae]|uniref:efflux transporter outer membrane subunit n=1 Tax=Paraburkholderia unamae TaxID=219649 RepID=UPI000DC343CE|nr:efflux transporter outer membrane subunit [Paraburkholderia unamae]RAR67959.1 NodT family efflux transporter outer membrane factor (OMF) lipoprotein [Paraburkholderia unamae]